MNTDRENLQLFHVPLETASVDADKGVIKGVSVITSGLTAVGHNIKVDDTTLLEMQVAAKKRGQVPVKWNHKTGADEVCGYLTDFRVDGSKLLADWHLLAKHPRRDQALELATRMPTGVGLSASFFGKNEKKGGQELARCNRLQSVDLVAAPAANPGGLFEEGEEGAVDSRREAMPKNTNTPGQEEEAIDLAAVMAKLNELGTSQETIVTRLSALEDGVADDKDDDLEDEDGVEGSDGNADSEGADPEEFESLGDVLTYFEQRLDQAENSREQAQQEQAFAEVEDRFSKLLELNEQLTGENEVLATAYRELSEHTGQSVELSAGADDGSYEAEFSGADDAKLTEFEAKVKELSADGKKTHAEAMLFAVENHGDLYEKHLSAKGAIAQSL